MPKNFFKLIVIVAATFTFIFAAGAFAQTESNPYGKSMVVYFSETGQTLRIAELIAKKTGAESYRIEAAVPFPAEEMEIIAAEEERRKNETAPTLKENPPDLSGYSLIFVGSPVWFGAPPDVVKLFLSEADFKGAKVAVFATSGTQPREILSDLSSMIKNGEVLEPGLLHKRADDQTQDALNKKVDDWLAVLFPPK
jgi:flavodoxin